MNRRTLNKRLRYVVIAGLGLIILTGCEQFFGDDNSYQTRIAPERTRRIETLDLQKAKEEKAPKDVNEARQVPPKELEVTLEECRALTLENNLDLVSARFDPQVAEQQVSEGSAVANLPVPGPPGDEVEGAVRERECIS